MGYLDKFIQGIENYYAPYDKKALAFIKQYLSKFTDAELKELLAAVMLNYSNTYKKAPDINQFERAMEKRYEQAGLKRVQGHYEDINRNVYGKDFVKIGHYDGPRFIPLLSNQAIRERVLRLGKGPITPEDYLKIKSETTKDLVIKDKE